MQSLAQFIGDVCKEVVDANAKYPGPYDAAAVLAALMGELGELAVAILDGEPEDAIYKEAVQVACVAARLAIECEPVDSAIYGDNTKYGKRD